MHMEKCASVISQRDIWSRLTTWARGHASEISRPDCFRPVVAVSRWDEGRRPTMRCACGGFRDKCQNQALCEVRLLGRCVDGAFKVWQAGEHVDAREQPQRSKTKLQTLLEGSPIWQHSAVAGMNAKQVVSQANICTRQRDRNAGVAPFKVAKVSGSKPVRSNGSIVVPLICASCEKGSEARRYFGMPTQHDLRTPQEYTLAKILWQYRTRTVITVADVNAACGAGLALRQHQNAMRDLFDLAAEYGAGVREGAPKPRAGRGRRKQSLGSPLLLRLTLDSMTADHKKKFGLCCLDLGGAGAHDDRRCSWFGAATFTPSDKMFRLYAEGAHDPRGQHKGGGAVTAEQCALLKKSKAKQTAGRLVSLNACAASPPTKRQEQDFSKREAKRRRLESGRVRTDQDSVLKDVWTVADLHDLMRELNIKERGATSESDELVLLEWRVYKDHEGKTQFTALYSTEELLGTLKRLENKDYIKVGTDATFREHRREVVLRLAAAHGQPMVARTVSQCTVPFGVITKHWGRSTVDGVDLPTWASHFSPVLYAVSSSESGTMYQIGFEAFSALPLTDVPVAEGGPSAGQFVRQVHGDWSPAVELARRTVWPHSIRAGDFRHALAAMVEKLPGSLLQTSHDATDSHFNQIVNAVCRSRTHCTTLLEFDHFWRGFFKLMRTTWRETAAEEYLRTTYFFSLSAADAESQYGISDPESPRRAFYCAAWWSSFERMQPGSACGTQCVESFHAHDFRGSFVDQHTGAPLTHLDPRQFLVAFRSTLRYQSRQLRKQLSSGARLADQPSGPDPTSRNSIQLKRAGRSTALELAEHAGSQLGIVRRVHVDGADDIFVFPRSLYCRSEPSATAAPQAWGAFRIDG